MRTIQKDKKCILLLLIPLTLSYNIVPRPVEISNPPFSDHYPQVKYGFPLHNPGQFKILYCWILKLNKISFPLLHYKTILWGPFWLSLHIKLNEYKSNNISVGSISDIVQFIMRWMFYVITRTMQCFFKSGLVVTEDISRSYIIFTRQ